MLGVALVDVVIVAAVVFIALVVAVVAGGAARKQIRVEPGAFQSMRGGFLLEATRGSVVRTPERSSEAGLLGSDSRTPTSSTKPAVEGLGLGAAEADAVANSAELWWSIDPSVYDAASQAAHAQINGLFDLGSVAHLDSWRAASEGLRHALSGHVGEFIAASHLEAAGVHTEMAASPTQQGWDAAIGHLQVNFKDYADFHSSGIARHFADNPHVPIVVPGDMHHVPSDTLRISPGEHVTPTDLAEHHVIALAGWHHDDAVTALGHAYAQVDPAAAVQDGLQALAAGNLGDAAQSLDVAFPFVTALLSTYREGKMMRRGDTRAGRAAKNVTLDVAGVGVGVGLGHTVGGVAGFAVAGPPGAVVGTWVGGLAGGLAGRLGSTHIRKGPLRRVEAELEQAQAAYLASAGRIEERLLPKWESEKVTVEARFHADLDRLSAEVDEYLSAVMRSARATVRVSGQEAERDIQSAVANRLSSSAEAPPWARRLGLLKSLAQCGANWRLKRDLKVWAHQASTSVEDLASDEPDAADSYFDLMLALDRDSTTATEFLQQVVVNNAQAYSALAAAEGAARDTALALRLRAVEELDTRWAAFQQDASTALVIPQKRVEAAERKWSAERRAAGGRAH